MLEYNLDIDKRSLWILAAQSPALPFFLTEIGHFFAGCAYYTKRSDKDGYYLVFTQAGHGCMRTAGAVYELSPGHAILIPCGPLHDYRTVNGHWEQLWMHVNGAGAAAFCALLEHVPVKLRDPHAFFRQFTALIPMAGQIDTVAAVRISHGVSALLTEMLISSHAATGSDNPSAHSAVEAALRCIEKNYREPLRIDDLAAAGSLSKYHFLRLFRRQVGVTPYHYLVQYRINQSKQLLCTTDAPVSEIASLVGFAGESNYIRQFGCLVGMTPAQFRRANINYLDAGETP